MLTEVHPRTGVGWHQIVHLHSLRKTLDHSVRQIRSIGHEGRSDDGSQYIPLSSECWQALAGPLEAILRLAEEAAGLSGDEREEPALRQFAATRTAISGRLAQMEEVISDLTPERLQKSYGTLPAAVASGLEKITSRMEVLLGEARLALERARPARIEHEDAWDSAAQRRYEVGGKAVGGS